MFQFSQATVSEPRAIATGSTARFGLDQELSVDPVATARGSDTVAWEKLKHEFESICPPQFPVARRQGARPGRFDNAIHCFPAPNRAGSNEQRCASDPA